MRKIRALTVREYVERLYPITERIEKDGEKWCRFSRKVHRDFTHLDSRLQAQVLPPIDEIEYVDILESTLDKPYRDSRGKYVFKELRDEV